MSSQGTQRNEGEAVPAVEGIPDFANLYARQTSFRQWAVLHIKADGSNTTYHVDLSEPSCTCPDFDYNRDDGEVCKHIAVALFEAPGRIKVEQQAVHDLGQWVRDAREAAEACRQHATALSADREVVEAPSTQGDRGNGTAGDTAAAESVSDEPETYGVENPEAVIEAWLEQSLPPAAIDHVDTRTGDHDSRVGVQLLPDNTDDGLTDAQYESFKAAVNSLEDSEPHVGFTDDGCSTCGEKDDEFWYFVPGGQIEQLAEAVEE